MQKDSPYFVPDFRTVILVKKNEELLCYVLNSTALFCYHIFRMVFLCEMLSDRHSFDGVQVVFVGFGPDDVDRLVKGGPWIILTVKPGQVGEHFIVVD